MKQRKFWRDNTAKAIKAEYPGIKVVIRKMGLKPTLSRQVGLIIYGGATRG